MSRLGRTRLLFVVNGGAATAVHFAILVLLVEILRVPYVGVANGLASVVGIAASFAGNHTIVFRSRRSPAHTLPRFLLLYGAIASLHMLFLFAWTDRAGLPYPLGFLLSTCLATIMSYVGNRWFVFPCELARNSHEANPAWMDNRST